MATAYCCCMKVDPSNLLALCLSQAMEPGLDLCNLYIRGLEPEISSARLQSMFEVTCCSAGIVVNGRLGYIPSLLSDESI